VSPAYAFTPEFLGALAGGGVVVATSFYETFDTTGYDNAGWIEVGSVYSDYVALPAPISGTQSLGTPSSPRSTATSPAFDNIRHIDFLVNIPSVGSSDLTLMRIQDSSHVILAYIYMRAARSLRCTHGSTISTSGAVITLGTTYHLWIDYTPGDGVDGILVVSIAEYTGSEVKPGSPIINIQTGTSQTTATYCELGTGNTIATGNVVFDNLKLEN